MKNAIAKINRSNRITRARKTGLILIGTIIVITCLLLIMETSSPTTVNVWSPDSTELMMQEPLPVQSADTNLLEWKIVQEFNRYIDSLKSTH